MFSRKAIRQALLLAVLCCAAGSSFAATTTVSGYFDDPTNTALISSNGYDDLGPAQFGPDGDVTRNVALYRLFVPVGGSVIQFTSSGYAAGGAQPYFSIFDGGDTTATFLDSSYFAQDIDFQVSETLAQGTYLFAIGVYANMSFAENNGAPDYTLSEGFTALVDPDLLGNAFYRVAVSSATADFMVGPMAPAGPTGPTDVPEPGAIALWGIGFAAFGARRRRPVTRSSRVASPLHS